MTTRREFLATVGTSAVLSIGTAAPSSLLLQAAADEPHNTTETVLVVIQLSGGNDGLNCVIPYRDELYRSNRPSLAIGEGQIARINDECGLHPSLRGMADLLEASQLAIIHGVGYPNPNRSHFESMDIWHTCYRKGGPRATGWLGRYLDAAQTNDDGDASALHLGGEKQPLALAADHVRTPTIRSLDAFRLHDGGDLHLRSTIEQLVSESGPGSDQLHFLRSTAQAALKMGRRVEVARQSENTPVSYPKTRLASSLSTVAKLIDADLGTRVFYLELAGFDTHARQAGAHAALLSELGDGLNAFLQDVIHRGHGQRVVVMAFSEFGRRVEENASAGTDHGAAGPVFLAGRPVRPGVIGMQPSLSDLVDGDLRFHTDFRQVYATILERWLKLSSREILGADYPPIDLFT